MSDEMEDPIAALDQARRGMRDLVALMIAHTTECEAQGYSRAEALRLTVAYQRCMLTPRAGGEDPA